MGRDRDGGMAGEVTMPGKVAMPGEEVLAGWRRAREQGRLDALGHRLRQLALTERSVRHRFGVHAVCHAPLQARMREPMAAIPPAALLAELFVAGQAAPLGLAQRWLGETLDELVSLGLLGTGVGAGQQDGLELKVRATVALLPVGEALVASDRADIFRGRDTVLMADDSAFHLIGVMPGQGARRGLRWLDVGTGSAIVPLACPGAWAAVLGTDIHARAIAMAELGIGLSGSRSIQVGVADLLASAGDTGPWDLITFNAPIPAHVLPDAAGGGHEQTPRYCVGDADIIHRFWRAAGAALAPFGRMLAHSWQPAADYPAVLGLPGQVTALRYTPPGHERAFGITEWVPDGPPQQRLIQVALAPSRPHLDRTALDLEPA